MRYQEAHFEYLLGLSPPPRLLPLVALPIFVGVFSGWHSFCLHTCSMYSHCANGWYCVCVCVCVCMCVCVCLCMCLCACVCVFVYLFACVPICLCVSVSVRVRVRVRVRLCVHICVAPPGPRPFLPSPPKKTQLYNKTQIIRV